MINSLSLFFLSDITFFLTLSRNALENIYTLLQPPRIPGRGGCPGEADGNVEDQKMDEQRVGMMEIRSVQGMPLSTFRTNKHPFYAGKMVRSVFTVNTLKKMVVKL